ncbi:MAG: hypothetical protein R3Y43_00160 [Alphaproteobacteria bacterium]
MKKTILTLLVLATISGCVKTHDKIEAKTPLLIPPSYGQKPAVK